MYEEDSTTLLYKLSFNNLQKNRDKIGYQSTWFLSALKNLYFVSGKQNKFVSKIENKKFILWTLCCRL